MVAAGHATVTTFTTPASASYIRFQTFASDASAAAHDLDMFVVPGRRRRPERRSPSSRRAAGRTQNEVVTRRAPAAWPPARSSRCTSTAARSTPAARTLTLFAWASDRACEQPVHGSPGRSGRHDRPGRSGHVRAGPASRRATATWVVSSTSTRPRPTTGDGGDARSPSARASTSTIRTTRRAGERRPFVVSEEYRERVPNRVLVYAEAVDVAAEGAVWYARRIAGGPFTALHVPGKSTDTGIHARWFDLTGGEPRLDVLPPGTDATKAVLEEIARAAPGDGEIVTVVLPEQFRKRSLMAAAQRAQFRLKLRLLVEPDVVVADVPAVTSERRPEGQRARPPRGACGRRPARRRDEAGGRLRPRASASTTCVRCTSASAPGTSPSSASRSTTSPRTAARRRDARLRPPADRRPDGRPSTSCCRSGSTRPCTACAAAARSRSSGACSSSRT